MTNFIYRSINRYQSTIPQQLRHFPVLAYIYYFDNNRELVFNVKSQWNIKRNYLMNQGIRCQK